MFTLTIFPGSDLKILLLAYYKNQILNFLFEECIVVLALSTFGIQLAIQEGVDKKRMIEEIVFLQRILQ